MVTHARLIEGFVFDILDCMSASLSSKSHGITLLKTVADCDSALADGLVILFKHSLSCPVSSVAKEEITSFKEAQPNVPVVMIHVQPRDLALHVEQVTGVPHASPQVIVLKNGKLLGTLSHYRITSKSISKLVGGKES